VSGDPFEDTMRRFHVDAAGVLELHVCLKKDVPGILAAAFLGDHRAMQLARSVNEALRRIQNAPPDQAALCGSCPRTLKGNRFALAVAIPARDDPRSMLALAICPKCGTSRHQVRRKATQSLARIWPDVREITVSGTAGHA